MSEQNEIGNDELLKAKEAWDKVQQQVDLDEAAVVEEDRKVELNEMDKGEPE